MSRTLTNPNAGNTVRGKIPVYNGGSNEDTAPLALAVFDGVPVSQFNQNNGIAGLDSTGHLLYSVMPAGISATIGLEGPDLLYTGKTGIWVINNYDNTITYTLSCTSGFVSRQDDKIYYTAPSTPGNAGFIINNKVIPVVVDDRYVTKPVITSPVQDMINVGAGITIATDDFSVTGGFPETIITASDKASGDIFGSYSALSTDGTRLAVCATFAAPGGLTEAGAVYIFRRDGATWVEEQKLTAFDKAIGDRFGRYVAITADGSRVVISAYYDDVGALSNCGSAYIYSRSGTVWTLEQKINASDKAADDQFGSSVAISADGTRLLVGASGCLISGAQNAGACYVFSRSGTVWTQEVKLSASVTVAQDLFGSFAAINSDGSRCVVSSPRGDISGVVDCGAAYVFRRSGTTWTQEAQLLANDRATGDGFGYSIDITDAGDRIIVSSYWQSAIGTYGAGKVYVFSRSGTTWTQEAKVTASDVVVGDAFGSGISINADGTRFIASSVAAAVDNLTKAGASYVFKRVGTTWIQETKVTPIESVMGDVFGSQPALASNDSIVSIGASVHTSGGVSNAGAVYVYDMAYLQSTDWQLSTDPGFTNIVQQSLTDTVNLNSWPIAGLALDTDYYVRCRKTGTQFGTSEWSDVQHFKTRAAWLPTVEQAILTASDKAAGNSLGIFCALSNDGTRLVVGAQLATVGGVSGAGAAYVFRKEGSSWVEEAKLSASDKLANDNFGRCVHMASDGSRIIVGAYYADTGGLTDAGAAYVFSRSGTTWTQEAKLTASDKAISDTFGVSVTLSGDGSRAAVGATGCTVGGVNSAGAVYIYSRSGTTWTQEAKVSGSTKVASDYFGYSCYLDATGTRLVVGADAADIGGVVDTGAGYIFVRSGVTWTQEAQLLASDRLAGDYLGVSCHISADGDRVALGAIYANIGSNSNEGAIYVFSRSGTTWTQEAKLTASDGAASDSFGNTISMTSDGSVLLTNSLYANVDGKVNAGAAYVFSRTGVTWAEQAKLSASNKAANDYFGSRLFLSGDGSVAAVAAHLSDPSGVVDAGCVYIFQ